MYGGGNIGRGFIGLLFAQSGYQVTFIDVAQGLVKQLHEARSYPVRIIGNDGCLDIHVANVDAVNGNDAAAAAAVIASADIMATAVGANVLKFIAPNIAAGLKKRFAETDRPLDIIICENLMDANRVLEGLIKEHLTPPEQALMDARVGLVEASIGRMVPVQTAEMHDGHPLRVCVEGYGYLPVDRDAFKGPLPAIEGLVPASPFEFYIKRKLYVHNMGHAACAYLGGYTGRKYIWQAIDDPDTLSIVENAMLESAMALSQHYKMSCTDMVLHITDLLARFRNTALKDTCLRVGGDPTRKLQPSDRLIGAAAFAHAEGIAPAYIAIGAAGAVYRYLSEANMEQSLEGAQAVLRDVAQVSGADALSGMILSMYRCFEEGEPISAMRRAAGQRKAASLRGII